MRVLVAKTFIGLEKYKLKENEYFVEIDEKDLKNWPYKPAQSKNNKSYFDNKLFSYYYDIIVWMPNEKRWNLFGHPELTVNFLKR